VIISKSGKEGVMDMEIVTKGIEHQCNRNALIIYLAKRKKLLEEGFSFARKCGSTEEFYKSDEGKLFSEKERKQMEEHKSAMTAIIVNMRVMMEQTHLAKAEDDVIQAMAQAQGDKIKVKGYFVNILMKNLENYYLK
jgi:hypothetical protein